MSAHPPRKSRWLSNAIESYVDHYTAPTAATGELGDGSEAEKAGTFSLRHNRMRRMESKKLRDAQQKVAAEREEQRVEAEKQAEEKNQALEEENIALQLNQSKGRVADFCPPNSFIDKTLYSELLQLKVQSLNFQRANLEGSSS